MGEGIDHIVLSVRLSHPHRRFHLWGVQGVPGTSYMGVFIFALLAFHKPESPFPECEQLFTAIIAAQAPAGPPGPELCPVTNHTCVREPSVFGTAACAEAASSQLLFLFALSGSNPCLSYTVPRTLRTLTQQGPHDFSTPALTHSS